ncbi:MAG: type II toxin-antitoxin system HigB family toxin [Acidobacteria bacterium]|nr:type II toxin-antitoxin system HigB family toxin [Acidobacteriota bacterium]MCI0628102.1 type II toxin-antitoxin system HigB family toxin [Acidobacteriota bacterium]MCI0719770.1 type II toxin-antitoxin system HigB family toxin [Acidobacteriota bacterium]
MRTSLLVRVISRKAIVEFIRRHPNASPSLESWYQTVRRADWNSLADAKKIYPSADQVGRRTVFNISGNQFRLVARINYRIKAVFVLHILTHQASDKGEWKQ